jgi:hypothetical protein
MPDVSGLGREFAWAPKQVPSTLSDPLIRFVRDRLPSLEQVEIVLLLRADPTRAWSAPEVSDRLGTPGESTAMRLFLLASNGVLVFDGTGGVPRYRYGGADAATDALVSELAQAYEQQREAVYELIGTPTRDPIRSFSDAFKLKK